MAKKAKPAGSYVYKNARDVEDYISVQGAERKVRESKEELTRARAQKTRNSKRVPRK